MLSSPSTDDEDFQVPIWRTTSSRAPNGAPDVVESIGGLALGPQSTAILSIVESTPVPQFGQLVTVSESTPMATITSALASPPAWPR
jgi:hypothetical protein